MDTDGGGASKMQRISIKYRSFRRRGTVRKIEEKE